MGIFEKREKLKEEEKELLKEIKAIKKPFYLLRQDAIKEFRKNYDDIEFIDKFYMCFDENGVFDGGYDREVYPLDHTTYDRLEKYSHKMGDYLRPIFVREAKACKEVNLKLQRVREDLYEIEHTIMERKGRRYGGHRDDFTRRA